MLPSFPVTEAARTSSAQKVVRGLGIQMRTQMSDQVSDVRHSAALGIRPSLGTGSVTTAPGADWANKAV